MSAESGRAEHSDSLGNTIAALRRYWWIVLIVVWLALLGGLLSAVRTPTAYIGRTSLVVSSSDRSPEQDAVLVQGYVSYFNNLPYQQQLLAEAGMNTKIKVSAEAAAASPIVVITATASDSETAQSAAIAVARVFKIDINKTHDQKNAAALATLQDQLDTARGGNGKQDQAVIASLQEQIRTVQADQDNVLQELQSQGGVTVQPPSLLANLGLGIAGGLVLGVLAALGFARFSPRLRSRHDVAEKVGLNTLVELPGPRSKGALLRREERLRQLANILKARLAGPGVVAVTQATDGAATRIVALGLAVEWATQGYPTVLVRFGGGSDLPLARIGGTTPPPGPADVPAVLSRMQPGAVPGLSILDLRPQADDGATTLSALKVAELFELEPLTGAFVILETPAVVSTAAAQAATVAADATVLVIDTQVAKVAETREAVGVLRQSGAALLGAVLALVRDEEGRPVRGDSYDINVGQPASPAPDRQSATGTAGWSWWPASGPADSPRDRSIVGDGTKNAQAATRNGASSRGAKAGKG